MDNASASDPPLDVLRKKLGSDWPNIVEAREASIETRQKIENAMASRNPGLLRTDTAFVIYGSLARNEYTEGSDVDWTLLVDGQADANDLRIAHAISETLAKNQFIKPKQDGAFGNIVFSPSLVHQIGGQQDTNHNTTQRILLLLESTSIGDDSVRDRVIRGILNRYLDEDTPFKKERIGTPRFLVNDLVRFWRTMAVDFASKQRERAGDGWALRNAKLRMSRKLIFVSGLLMCYRFQAVPDGESNTETSVDLLRTAVDQTPLDMISESLLELEIPNDISVPILHSYDQFLAVLNDRNKREYLDKLNYESSRDDNLFQEVRRISTEFQHGLVDMFFRGGGGLKDWIEEYGVF